MSVYRFPLPTILQASFPHHALRQDVQRVMNDVFTTSDGTLPPSTDAREDAVGFTLEVDVPGIAPDAIEVLAEEGVLTVRGARPERELGAEEKLVFTERARGPVSRRFRLPKSADLSAISASYANGVLTVRVAKLAPATPRRVAVNVES
jgi:HSP20 family protein